MIRWFMAGMMAAVCLLITLPTQAGERDDWRYERQRRRSTTEVGADFRVGGGLGRIFGRPGTRVQIRQRWDRESERGRGSGGYYPGSYGGYGYGGYGGGDYYDERTGLFESERGWLAPSGSRPGYSDRPSRYREPEDDWVPPGYGR
jgi:hypothetical protein